MANSGDVMTYGEPEARSNRLAQLLRARGLRRLDHYAVFMESNARLATRQAVALAALPHCPNIELCLITDGPGDGAHTLNLDEATAGFPVTPIPDESLGNAMLYSSGTTARPKGVRRPLPEQPPSQCITSLPHPCITPPRMSGSVNLTIRMGGTAVIM